MSDKTTRIKAYNPYDDEEELFDIDVKDLPARLRKLFKKYIKGTTEAPTFSVTASGCFDNLGDTKGCHLTFVCPLCGKKNSHGGYFEDRGKGDGHRVSHCPCWPNGYYIKEK